MLLVLVSAALLLSPSTASCVGVACDALFARAAPGELLRQERLQDAPQIPWKNFSASYVARALATPVDWTLPPSRVTPVKNQGAHGYCGTFGRVGSAEGQWARATGAPVSFSEEELIDCIGWDQDQYSYFASKGFMTSADYAYNLTGPDMDPPIPFNPCRYDASLVVNGTAGFFNGRTGQAPSEDQLAAFVSWNGPVSAGINADVFGLRAKGCEATNDCFITPAMCKQVAPGIDHR